MNRAEWEACTDVAEMLAALWDAYRGDEDTLAGKLHRFYLDVALGLGPLLPQEESRQGILMGMRYQRGDLSSDELLRANYEVEGAAFRIDYDKGCPEVAQWVRELEDLPVEELEKLVHPEDQPDDLDARALLTHAAYFADFAMLFPTLSPSSRQGQYVRVLPVDYLRFLSPDSLREAFPAPPLERC